MIDQIVPPLPLPLPTRKSANRLLVLRSAPVGARGAGAAARDLLGLGGVRGGSRSIRLGRDRPDRWRRSGGVRP